MGKLYIVGTPIGNLGDITYRAVETLRSVDFICAEDTRVTAKLANHFGIKTPLISYHEHNAKTAGETICRRIESGESAAIVTDAGMPCISDPGEDLVKLCAARGIEVNVVPGASAATAALAASGLDTSRFSFEGFLSVTKRQRFSHLAMIKDQTSTLIFYEAPHKLLNTLNDLLEYLGDRRVAVCRELTKLHEEIMRTTLSRAAEYYTLNKPRGEFVLIIEGADVSAKEEELTPQQAIGQVRALIAKGMRGADACREIAKESGYSKSELYSMLIAEDED